MVQQRRRSWADRRLQSATTASLAVLDNAHHRLLYQTALCTRTLQLPNYATFEAADAYLIRTQTCCCRWLILATFISMLSMLTVPMAANSLRTQLTMDISLEQHIAAPIHRYRHILTSVDLPVTLQPVHPLSLSDQATVIASIEQ